MNIFNWLVMQVLATTMTVLMIQGSVLGGSYAQKAADLNNALAKYDALTKNTNMYYRMEPKENGSHTEYKFRICKFDI